MNAEQIFFMYILMPGLCLICYVGIWNNWVYLEKTGYNAPRPSLFLFTKMMVINTFRFCIFKQIIPFNEVK